MAKGTARVRILFALENSELGDAEVLWAEPITETTYRLDNIPLLVFGVSMGDTVWSRSPTEPYVFAGIASRGGHSTYRLMLEAPDQPATRARFRELVTLGCGYEELTARFIAIDVPERTDIFRVYDLLERGLDDGIWTFEEGHCGHDVTESA
jgi:hypothetical protein